MKFLKTAIPEVILIEPRVFDDNRGFFLETYHKRVFAENGIDVEFVQDNHSRSTRNVLRGLHFQNPTAQGKLVRVTQGAVFDVAVDIRVGSPSFGKWVGETISSENQRFMYIPAGFAHGFLVQSDVADFLYKCTDYYHPENEGTIRWNDESIDISWPSANPICAEKDAAGMSLEEYVSFARRFTY